MILAVLLIPNMQLCLSSPGGSECFKLSLTHSVYQHTAVLIKNNLFLPTALEATDSSQAILKNAGELLAPCLAALQDGRALHRKQDGEEADLVPAKDGHLIMGISSAGSLEGHLV